MLAPGVLIQIGKIYRILSRYDQAIESFRAAAAKNRSLNNRGSEAEALKMLGGMSAWLGDYVGAKEHYQRALDIYRSDKDAVGQMDILAALILVLVQPGFRN